MKTAGISSVVWMLLGGIAAAAAEHPDAAKIQGTWLVDDLLIAGLHTEKDPSLGQKMTITAERIVLKYKDGTKREMTFKLDPRTAPKSIDVRHSVQKGQPKEQDWMGIYELDGDTLTLSLENGGPVRPQIFQPAGDSGIVYKLKREKPKVGK